MLTLLDVRGAERRSFKPDPDLDLDIKAGLKTIEDAGLVSLICSLI